MSELRYPYSRQDITDADVAEVSRALRAPLLTQGAEVDAFEAALAEQTGSSNAIACANGTAALHLAYAAVGLGPRRGLLTSPVTFLATANAARMTGAAVIFADVDPATGNIDPESVERTLAESDLPVAAIAPVHLGGRPCDMPSLSAIAKENDCLLIEDSCHALGAYAAGPGNGRHRVGSCGSSDAAVFSFHAIKHVAMGEGGAVCTNDDAAAARIRLLRNHGIVRDPKVWADPPEPAAPWYYEMDEIGFNYRLTDIQCALGRSQLARLDTSLTARRRIAASYGARLADVPHVTPPAMPATPDEHAWHLYSVAIDFAAAGKSRGEVMRALAARGVGSQVHYIPLYRQPYYRRLGATPLPGVEAYYSRTLSLPMYPTLNDHDVDTIVGALEESLAE